jgi:hypothetical protein
MDSQEEHKKSISFQFVEQLTYVHVATLCRLIFYIKQSGLSVDGGYRLKKFIFEGQFLCKCVASSEHYSSFHWKKSHLSAIYLQLLLGWLTALVLKVKINIPKFWFNLLGDIFDSVNLLYLLSHHLMRINCYNFIILIGDIYFHMWKLCYMQSITVLCMWNYSVYISTHKLYAMKFS